MKKLRLKALDLCAREILSREQMRSINGGCGTLADCDDDYYCGTDGNCQYAGIPGSGNSGGSGGSIGDTCDGVLDENGHFIDTCPHYSLPDNVFSGCVPC
jgi:hypothetical protein